LTGATNKGMGGCWIGVDGGGEVRVGRGCVVGAGRIFSGFDREVNIRAVIDAPVAAEAAMMARVVFDMAEPAVPNQSTE